VSSLSCNLKFVSKSVGFTRSHPGIQYYAKTEVRKQKSENRNRNSYTRQQEAIQRNLSTAVKNSLVKFDFCLIYAYDNNCLYWMEKNFYFILLLFFISTVLAVHSSFEFSVWSLEEKKQQVPILPGDLTPDKVAVTCSNKNSSRSWLFSPPAHYTV
jgi:hypothetical protein